MRANVMLNLFFDCAMHVYSGNYQIANGEISLSRPPLIRTTGPVITVGLPAGEKTARQCILATARWNLEGRVSVEDGQEVWY